MVDRNAKCDEKWMTEWNFGKGEGSRHVGTFVMENILISIKAGRIVRYLRRRRRKLRNRRQVKCVRACACVCAHLGKGRNKS